ncbi:MAG: GDSL-type esterase/lipase family protein [Planctomycetaceae bacterium]
MKTIIPAALSMVVFVMGTSSADENSAAEWKYDPEMLRPLWTGDTVRGESLLFVKDPETGEAKASVLFPVTEVLGVCNSAGDTCYEEGRDFVWQPESREIRLPKNSRIASFAPEDLRRPAGTQKYRLTHRDGGGEILFGALLEYHQMQTSISYRHKPEPWPSAVPAFDANALPRTIQKLQHAQPVSVVLIGDSISTGCNASGWASGAPFQPAYPELLQRHLEASYGASVQLTNLSVGGMATPWMLTMIEKVVEPKPDLVIIAFGMNDSAGRSAEEYQANTKAAIAKIRESLPDCEFVLVATMLGNPDWTLLKQELFPQYRDALAELCEPGIVLADVTSVWTEFLKRKQDRDLTGNGVNHPNDFGHRVYAQVLSTLLVSPAAFAAAQQASPKAAPEPIEVSLWNGKAPNGDGTFDDADPKITVHRPSSGNGTVVVICPGGGYGGLVTDAEGHGIAEWLNGHEITGVVLEYRLPAGRPYVPLLDAQQAIRTVRANAKAWNIDPSRVGIIGFSAGGHLASTAATHFDSGDSSATDPVARQSSRPDFAILVYPVVTMDETTHAGCRKNLLGPNPAPEMIELFSNEKQVTKKSSPTFLTHAVDDKAVSADNSRLFFEALKGNGVPTEYLELPSGGHGLNGYQGPMWDAWQKQSLEWLVRITSEGGR